jgi:hypothetical protein
LEENQNSEDDVQSETNQKVKNEPRNTSKHNNKKSKDPGMHSTSGGVGVDN